MIYSYNNSEATQNVLIIDGKPEVKKIQRIRRTGTVVVKQKGGFPLTAKLYDVSTISVRAYIELQLPIGTDYYLDSKVYCNGQQYVFSCNATCSVCSLNGRGFLAEFMIRTKNQNLTDTLATIMKN